MRALRIDERGVHLEHLALPDAGEEVRVAVTMSGICNTDLEIAKGYAGFRGTLGHEFVGVVDDPGKSAWHRGQRVVGEINAGCGACARCAAGDPRHCPRRTVLGIVGRDGAHAEALCLPACNLLPVPEEVSDAAAVFVEPLAAACGVLERCPIEPGSRVAVIGDGKLGLLCAQVLAVAGHAPLLIGKHPAKLALARGVEGELVEVAARRGRSFEVVVEASGSASGFSLALELLQPGGALVLKSTFHGATGFDASRVVVEELRVIGSRCGRFAPALELLASGAIDVAPLISEVLPLSRGVHALERARTPGVLKVLLDAAR